MKFSLDWLNDFVDVASAGGADGVSRALNASGIEIGAVEVIGSDTVIDADITPNRPDAMNHRGLARDLAAARAIPFQAILPRHEPPTGQGEAAESLAAVTVEVPEICRRFAVSVIRGTKTAASPEALRRRFEAIGLNPINVLVDATNLSLWEIGQPLHAFDANRVEGRRLIVRHARKGERLRCLDGVERELHPEDVVVADAKRVLSLAGVIGGVDSAISESTSDVLLEAAWWDPVSVRRTARRHGLHTDASHRYERGADIEAIPAGLALATREIVQTAGGRLAPGIIDIYPAPAAARSASLRTARLLELVGDPSLDASAAAAILERLGFAVRRQDDSTLAVRIPSWRLDVEIEEDLIEEVARIRGYDRIPSILPPAQQMWPRFIEAPSFDDRRPAREIEDRAADAACAAGLSEAINYPFSPGTAWEEEFGNLFSLEHPAAVPLRVENPLDSGRANLRRLILPGLLEAASRNYRNGARSIMLFETGRVWDRDAGSGSPAPDTPLFESLHLAFVLTGEAPAFWDRPVRGFDVFDARAAAQRVLDRFPEWGGCGDFVSIASDCPAFLPGACAAIDGRDGRRVGVFGRLSEGQRRIHLLPAAAVAGEIDLSALSVPREAAAFSPFSTYPPIDVDVTFSHPESLAWAVIRKEIEMSRFPNLEGIAYTGRFRGPGVAPGQVKSTISLRFRSPERTLSQEEVAVERDRLLAIIERKAAMP